MIIQLENRIQDIIPAQIETCLSQLKIPFYPVETQKASYLVCTPEGPFDIRLVGHLEGVKDVHIVGDKHKMVNKRWKVEDTVIDLGDGLSIGRDEFAIMAGPCSIDTAENIEVHFINTPISEAIIINEINYNSSANFDSDDWIELYNASSESEDISNWTIKDDDDSHIFSIPDLV